MKILTFTHLFPNPLQPVWGVFVQQRISHFAGRPDNLVKVVAPVPFIPRWIPSRSWEKYKHIPLSEKVGGLQVDHPRYPLIPRIGMPLHGILLFLGCFRHVARLHREHHFDCIDSHWIYPDGFAAVLFARVLGIPVFCSARGTDINVYPSFRLIRPLIRWSLRRATGIIAVSSALKTAIVELGISEEKVRVIGNGVDISRFRPLDREVARQQLGLPADAPLLVAVGSLNEHKGHSSLISAFSNLSSRHPNLRLSILGEGPLRNALEAQVEALGLHGRITLPGSVNNDQLAAWYSAADVSCLPSLREGWPNVLMESLACGTPVVASRVGGVPEVITSAEYGLLVDPNVESLTDGIESALRNSWNRAEIVKYAQSRTWDKVAAEMEEFMADRCASTLRRKL